MVLAGLVAGPLAEPDAGDDQRAHDDREHDDRGAEHHPIEIGDRTRHGTFGVSGPRHAPPTLGQRFDGCQSMT